jgi:two-component system sensor histidine kinase AlgZ
VYGVKRDVAAVVPAPDTRAEAAAAVPPQIIPDGCNLGVVLRVLLGVHSAAFVVVLAAGGFQAAVWTQFMNAAGFVAPVTLLTLILWCLARRLLPPLPARARRAIAWAVPVVVTALVLKLLALPQYETGSAAVVAFLLIALIVGASTQHYLELRSRAFSPALAQARLQALQSRIRPHFLFNSLNAVLSVIRADPAKAERLLESIAELFRAIMADTRRVVPLAEELALCRDYVEIEQTRLGDRLQVDWQIGAYHPKVRVPQLLLQPIIENAVRYGAEQRAGPADIIVRVRQRGFSLELFVSNPSAPGRPERVGNQMGLANIRGRLHLIYDLEAKLETTVKRERFELTITLPVELRDE